MRKRIALIAVSIAGLIGMVFLYFRVNSMTNMNIFPRQYMDEYLAQVYDEEFAFCSQSYHYATNYHIWTFTYTDKNGIMFNQYYYIDAPKNLRYFLEVKDYGCVWDTYAENKIKTEIAEIYDIVSYEEGSILPEEGYPRRHFNFQIDDENELKETAKCLSIIYQKIYEIADSPKAATLICGIYKDDKLIELLDLPKLKDNVGPILNEDELYQYLKSL